MHDLDAVQAMYAIREVCADDAMNFFTFVSAYLAVAFFVGRKLSTFQVWAISCLYSVWIVAPMMATYVALVDMNTLGVSGTHPMIRFPLVLPVLMGASWLVSIVFMIQARKPDDESTRPELPLDRPLEMDA